MPQILRNKNLATRFQIMVAIAAKQPFIQQKDIAKRVGVTGQAISEYISAMEKDGWLSSDGRSNYRLTKEGVNWLLKALRELQQYAVEAERALTNIVTWAAIADNELSKGQEVGIAMRDGLLIATKYSGKGARAITTSKAQKGDDVGVTNIEDIVYLEIGKVTVVMVNDIQSGGSAKVNFKKLQTALESVQCVGALGVEAIISLKKLNITPDYIYGVAHAAIEAVRSGLSFAIVCTTSESPLLLQKLSEENVVYKLVDATTRK